MKVKAAVLSSKEGSKFLKLQRKPSTVQKIQCNEETKSREWVNPFYEYNYTDLFLKLWQPTKSKQISD